MVSTLATPSYLLKRGFHCKYVLQLPRKKLPTPILRRRALLIKGNLSVAEAGDAAPNGTNPGCAYKAQSCNPVRPEPSCARRQSAASRQESDSGGTKSVHFRLVFGTRKNRIRKCRRTAYVTFGSNSSVPTRRLVEWREQRRTWKALSLERSLEGRDFFG
uniref:Uncharacterized protein n=1 Tax=Steinernema glaseri TaxID=37863 RepID=A0A1I8ATT1_9BILA